MQRSRAAQGGARATPPASGGRQPAARAWPAGRRAHRRARLVAALLALGVVLGQPAGGAAETEVAADWELVPAGVGAGQAFRLLFVTSAPRHALDPDIGSYNRTVQALARRSGHRAIRPHWAGFRAVASTPGADAKGNTATAWTPASKGVPIHWLGGARVAGDYADFYDGDWAGAVPTDESGARLSDPAMPVFTGTAGDGRAAERPLGVPAGPEGVRYGLPGAGPLSHGDRDGAQLGRLYALSAVFVVAGGRCEAVWCASLTAADHARDPSLAGYLAGGAYPGGRLEPARFDYRGTGYAVGGLVNARNSSELLLQLSPLPAEEEVRALTLRAGGIALPFAAATRNAQLGAYQWTDPATLNLAGTPFAAGARLRLRIEEGVTASPPGAPGDLAATVGRWAEIELRWTAPGRDGGAPVRGYRVEVSADHGASWRALAADTGSALTAYRHAGLAPGATLHYRVAALNAAGPGQPSSVAVGSTPALATLLAAPVVAAPAGKAPAPPAPPAATPGDPRPRRDATRPAAEPILTTNPLLPPGVRIGDRFRMLFLTVLRTQGVSTDIEHYNRWVRQEARTGSKFLVPFASGIRAVASTADVDAIDNTSTTYTSADRGLPIYWLGGAEIAEDYVRFYSDDVVWTNVQRIADEFGPAMIEECFFFWSGTGPNGEERVSLFGSPSVSRALGSDAPGLGALNCSISSSLESPFLAAKTWTAPFLGLTGVLEAVAAGGTVPDDWSLTPPDLAPGEPFRLLFVTDTTRDAGLQGIDHYNEFVRIRAAAGHRDIRDYSEQFRAVASTAFADARDNTFTTFSGGNKGVPIYWLGGARVADDYADFYDGSWADEANPKDPRGESAATQAAAGIWTGTKDDGTKDTAALGADYPRRGAMNNSGAGLNPLFGPNDVANASERALYGLSPVFRSRPPAVMAVSADWPLVPAGMGRGGRFRLLFLTSETRDGSSGDIAVYNRFVQQAAASGHAYIQGWSERFRAVASTADMDARVNTATVGSHGRPGVPIYWLGGARVAGDYEGFYDGKWDEEESVRDESGAAISVPLASRDGNVWTGSASDGTEKTERGATRALGTSTPAVGQLNTTAAFSPLDLDSSFANTAKFPLYGLSPVFEVLAKDPETVDPEWFHLPHDLRAGQLFRLLFGTFRSECDGLDGTSPDIAVYNRFVQCQAGQPYNDAVIRKHAEDFKALVSTADVDARDNTATAGADASAPIYWIGGREPGERGGRVADDYADFYDGDWDSERLWHYSTGNSNPSLSTDEFLTGSRHDGTRAPGAALGEAATVATGLLDSRRAGPLAGGPELPAASRDRFYGLSPYFELRPGRPGRPRNLEAAPDVDGETATLSWDPPAARGHLDILDITGYIPYVRTGRGASAAYESLLGVDEQGSPVALGPDELSYQVTEPGFYRVTALNSAGEGPPSQVVQVTGIEAGPQLRGEEDDPPGGEEESAPPLTAAFVSESLPAAHAGAGTTFTARVQFSEPVATSFLVLKEKALQVSNGQASRFRRVDGRSDLWEIHVQPESNAAVTLALGPSPADCKAADAVCTEGGKPLSNAVAVIVAGP